MAKGGEATPPLGEWPTHEDAPARGLGLAEDFAQDPRLARAKRRFRACMEWEGTWRSRFIDDIKFADADEDNGYQWPELMRQARDDLDKPCLTMNIIRQHNLQIVNQGKLSKTEALIVAAGNNATKESADMFDQCVRRIQYQSDAQQAYSTAREYQVKGGVGYWRLTTDYMPGDVFDLDIFIVPVEDPLSIIIDRDAKSKTGRDAMYAMVFDRVKTEEFREAYPRFERYQGDAPLGDVGWYGETDTDHVQVCEYFEKVPSYHTLLSFVDPRTGARKVAREHMLPRNVASAVREDRNTRVREVLDYEVQWVLYVGSTEVDRTLWPGKTIPIVRVLGEKSVIEGTLDIKGHTRAMKSAQRMFNYNASAQVEFGALQSKIPYLAADKAIEGFEDIWATANIENKSVLPYRIGDDLANPIPPPQRQPPPQSAPAFAQGMETAFNQLMMVSGQWQNQMGMQGNERTGEAISQRQEQGDVATAHFQDNYDEAIVETGRQLVELIPLVYDTKRVLRIQADDGKDFDVEVDPSAAQAYVERQSHNGQAVLRVFNPQVGRYDVRSTPGAAQGTRREQTVKAMTLLLTQAPGLTGLIGDLLLRAMDFKEATEAAERLYRMVPKQALGQGPSQQEQELQAKLNQLQSAFAKLLQQTGKDQLKLVGKDQLRDIDVYKAETDRVKAVADILMQVDPMGAAQLVSQLVSDTQATNLAPIMQANASTIGDDNPAGTGGSALASGPEAPPHPEAQKAPDGEWYLADPTRRGRYLKLAPLAVEHKGQFAEGLSA